MSNRLESQQVSWWSVHEFITAAIQQADISSFPLLGTPAWCELANGDPRKLAALFDAAQHWALRVKTFQEARAEASRAVAGAADWSMVASQARSREEFHRAHPWMKRVSA